MSPKVLIVGASATMPHGKHERDMVLQAGAELGVTLVPTDSTTHPEEHFDGYVCFKEAFTQTTAAFDPKGNDVSVVRRLATKDEARAVLREAGLVQPASGSDLDSIPGPWVVKPRTGSGSEGLSFHDSVESARAALAAGGEGYIAETFVTGEEFSVEGIVIDGEPHIFGVTEKLLAGPGAAAPAVEMGHVYPSRAHADHAPLIADTVARALRAWGVRRGIIHVEGWLAVDPATGAATVTVGEGHVRPGGDFIHLLVSTVHDANIFRPLVADAAGLPVESFPAPVPGRRAAVRYFDLPVGTVTRVTGVEEALASPGIIGGYFDVAVGDVLGPVLDSAGRRGCLVAVADYGADVMAVLDAAMRKVVVEVEAPNL